MKPTQAERLIDSFDEKTIELYDDGTFEAAEAAAKILYNMRSIAPGVPEDKPPISYIVRYVIQVARKLTAHGLTDDQVDALIDSNEDDVSKWMMIDRVKPDIAADRLLKIQQRTMNE